MNIATLCEGNDREMRQALDRYLAQLSGRGETQLWNEDDILPGQDIEAVTRGQLQEAGLVLLLVSQDFWASPSCYEQAQWALQICRENPAKKLAVVLLRPNSIAETPFKDYTQLPAREVCISQYRDPEQGYWDTYQGIKTLLDPKHAYKKRPKIAALRGVMLGALALFFWSIFVLLLPLIYPQQGLKIVPEPFKDKDDMMYYKMYKLDAAPQSNVMLSFAIALRDTARCGGLIPYALVSKTGDSLWQNMSPVEPHERLYLAAQDMYLGQCVALDFKRNDAGEYRFYLRFSKPVSAETLRLYKGNLKCDHIPCSISESDCTDVAHFSTFHCLYFQKTRLLASVLIFVLITLMLYLFLNIKKLTAYHVA